MAKVIPFSLVLVLGAGLGATVAYVALRDAPSDDATSDSPRDEPQATRATGSSSRAAHEDERAVQPAAAAPNAVPTFSVCDSGSTLPSLQRLKLSATDSDVWAIHCGASVELITLEGAADALVPRRIASMNVVPSQPKLSLRSAPLLASDLSGDGKLDLIVPVRAHDETGAPRSGASYELIRDAHGGFGAIKLLSAAPTVALAGGHFATSDVTDLALIALEDPRVALPSELIVMRGGPAPVKVATAKLGVDARAAIALDMNLDTRDELVVTSAQPSAELISFDAQGAVTTRVPWDIPNAKEALTADVDGDGHDDAVIVGDSLTFVLASQTVAQPHTVPNSEQLQIVSATDANADGKLDFVAYSAPNIVVLEHRESQAFERRTLCTLAASTVTPLAFGVAAQDARYGMQLLVLALDTSTPRRAQLGLVTCTPGEPRPWRPQATAIADAPLRLRFELR